MKENHLILHRKEGTGGMEIDPQPILMDKAALSSSESRGTMWHIVLVAPTAMQLFYEGSM
jgi:hypothetical protein